MKACFLRGGSSNKSILFLLISFRTNIFSWLNKKNFEGFLFIFLKHRIFTLGNFYLNKALRIQKDFFSTRIYYFEGKSFINILRLYAYKYIWLCSFYVAILYDFLYVYYSIPQIIKNIKKALPAENNNALKRLTQRYDFFLAVLCWVH